MMPFIAKRWYVMPAAATVALWFCVLSAQSGVNNRGLQFEKASLGRIYGLASQGKYDDLKRTGLLADPYTKYLEDQERCFGPILEWRPLMLTNDRLSWQARVYVRRAKLESIDSVTGLGPRDLTVGIDGRVSEWTNISSDKPSSPLSKPKDVIDFVAPELHRSVDNLKSATAERIGDLWLVTETTIDDLAPIRKRHKRYLVITKSGEVIEHVREALNDYPTDVAGDYDSYSSE
jgi:hypothetical protein